MARFCLVVWHKKNLCCEIVSIPWCPPFLCWSQFPDVVTRFAFEYSFLLSPFSHSNYLFYGGGFG